MFKELDIEMLEGMLAILLDHYDNMEDMQADFENVGAYRMASGGCFSISYDSQRLDLEDSGFIPTGSKGKYTDDQIFEMYKEAVAITLDNAFA